MLPSTTRFTLALVKGLCCARVEVGFLSENGDSDSTTLKQSFITKSLRSRDDK